MHVRHSLQSVRSKKKYSRLSLAFVLKHGILQLVTWGLKYMNFCNECLSVVSDRTVIYCLFMVGQACFNRKPREINEIVREGITHTVHAGSHYEM